MTQKTPIENKIDALERTTRQRPISPFEGTSFGKKQTVFETILTIFVFLALTPLIFSLILLIAAYEETIAIYAPAESIVGLERNVLSLVIIVLVLILILIVFASVWISRTFTRPLKYLIEATKRVAKEDFSFQLKVLSNDEFGELSEFFNMMIARLKEYKEREQIISSMKSEFISIAAHQLRTPLSAIKWTLRLMMDGDVGAITPDQKLFLERGYEANEKIINLVGDLLNVSRIEEGRFGYVFEVSDIIKLIKDTIKEFDVKAKERDIKIVFEPGENKVINLKMDTSRINLALNNLLDNALKYSLPKGSVIVNLKEEGPFLKLSVSDSGVGIPKTSMDRMFHKFFRAENVIKLQTEGSGLGLFIVKNIIERHGGKIWVESEENKGTTFFFTLPIKESLIPDKETLAI
jgi:signal transduction histidine kinase